MQILQHLFHALAEIRERVNRAVQGISGCADGFGQLCQRCLHRCFVPGSNRFPHRLAKPRKAFTYRREIVIELCEIVPKCGKKGIIIVGAVVIETVDKGRNVLRGSVHSYRQFPEGCGKALHRGIHGVRITDGSFERIEPIGNLLQGHLHGGKRAGQNRHGRMQTIECRCDPLVHGYAQLVGKDRDIRSRRVQIVKEESEIVRYRVYAVQKLGYA